MLGLEDPIERITSPLDYMYMRLLRCTLRIISGWPGRELGERGFFFEGYVHAYFNTSLSLVYLCLGYNYLRIHWLSLNFMEAGHMIIVLLCNLLCVSRATTLCLGKKYRSVAVNFITEMHLFYHVDKSDIGREVLGKVHRISHMFTVYLYFVFWLTILMFVATPVYSNYMRGYFEDRSVNLVDAHFEHSVFLTLPWNSDTNFNGYCFAQVINACGTFLCGSSIIIFDLFLSLMIFNLWGHFTILIHKLNNFPKPASCAGADGGRLSGAEMYSEAELKTVSAQLKECIEYHKLIIDFTEQMSAAFGLTLLAYYMFHQVSGCLLLLEVSQMTTEALMRYVPITFIFFQQLIQVSVIFENIGTMSEKVKSAVYELPWEYMDTANRRTVMFFLLHVQTPVHVKAGSMIDVGVTTMAAILKTSFSYFTFLRTVAD